MPIAWLRQLLRRRRRVHFKPRPNDVRLLAYQELEDRRLLALPPGITTSTFSAPWINMGPAIIATNPTSGGLLSGVPVNNGSLPESLTPTSTVDPVAGSVTSIAVDPANGSIAWVGTTNGGIFQTQNLTNSSGPTWVPQLDRAASLSISSIYADPTDATGNTVVATATPTSNYNTNDTDLSGLNIIATPVGGLTTGVYRSTNAASTAAAWTLLKGFPTGNQYVSVVEQGAVIMAAFDSALTGVSGGAGFTGGVYYSSNNGSTAITISNGSTSNLPSGAVSDLVSGITPNYVYAAVLGANGGIYGSASFGATGTWVKLNGTGTNALPDMTADENIQIAVSKQGTGGTAATLYVGLVDSSGNMTGVYKGSVSFLNGTIPPSANSSWTSIGAPSTVASDGTTYGLETTVTSNPTEGAFLGITDFSIAADPTNANLVYVGGDVTPGPYGSAPGGPSPVGRLFVGNASTQQWTSLTSASSAPAAGSHALVFASTSVLLNGNDGGIYELQSPSSGSGNWISLNGAADQPFNPLSPTGSTLTSLVNTEVTGVTDLPLTGNPGQVNPVVIGSAVNSGTFIQHSTQTSTYDSILGGDGGVVTTDSIYNYAPSASSVTLYTSNAGLANLQRQAFGSGGTTAGAAVPLPLAITGGTTGQTLYTYNGGLGLGYNSPLVTNNVMPGWIAIGSQYVFLSQDQGNTLTVDGGAGSPYTLSHINAMVYGGISAGQATFYPISPVSPDANPYLLWVGTSGGTGANLYVQLLWPQSPLVNNQVPPGAQLFSIPGVTGNVTAIAMDPNDDTVVFVGTAGGLVYQIVNTNPTGDPTWSDPNDLIAVQTTGSPNVGHITSMVYVPAANSGSTDQIVVSGLGGGNGYAGALQTVARASITATNLWSGMSTSGTVSQSLPDTSVMSMVYDQTNDLLIVGTLGRGIYEIASFAKSLGGIQVNVTGPGASAATNTLLVTINPYNSSEVDFYFNPGTPGNEPDAPFAYNNVSKVVVNLTTAVNNVILDFSYGDPLPTGVNSFTYTASGTGALATSMNTITIDDTGSFTLNNGSLSINSNPQSQGNGVVTFPTAGIIRNAVFNPFFTPYNILGATINQPTPASIPPYPALALEGSTYSIGSGGPWTGNAQLNGTAGVLPTPNTVNATMINTSAQPISLANGGLQVQNGQFFGFLNMLVANVVLGADKSYIDVSQWSGTGSLNGLQHGNLGYVNTPITNPFGSTGGSTYFAYAQTFFAVYQGEYMTLLGFTGLNLDGTGGENETWDNQGWIGTVAINGGPGTNSVYTSPPQSTTARNFSLYSPIATPGLTLPGFVYDQLSDGSAANYVAETVKGAGKAFNNYVNGGPGSLFDVSNYSALTNGSANGFDFVYLNGNGANTTINDAPPSGNTNFSLTSSSLFSSTNLDTVATTGDPSQLPQVAVKGGTNTIAILIAAVQNIILNTVSGNNQVVAYSWGDSGTNGFKGGAVFSAGDQGQDTFYVGGPSGNYAQGASTYAGDLDNIDATVQVFGGGGSTLENNDYQYSSGTSNMYYDISGNAAGGGSMAPDGQTPRTFGTIAWDNNVSNVIVAGAATDGNSAVVKYLMTPSLTSNFTIYGNPSSVNNFLGTFFYQTAVQQLYDITSPTTAVQENQYIDNGDFWYWYLGNRASIYFQNIGGVNGLGTLALGGGNAGSTSSTADVTVINPATGELGNSFPISNYPAGFQGGVTVASGNFTPNVKGSPDEIVTAPGPGTTSTIDIFNTSGKMLFSFLAYPSTFLGGTNVAVGNVTDNGTGLDIITAPQFGIEPVEVWHVSNLTTTPTVTKVNSFYPYGTSFNGGVSVAAGDFNGDGYDDVVTSPFTGMATLVNVYSGQVIASGAAVGGSNSLINSFSAFTSSFTGGSTVAVGDIDGDGVPDIVVAAGTAGSSMVQVMSGAGVATGAPSIAELAGFQVFTSSSTNASGQNILYNAPLRIALADIDGSGRDALFATQGEGGNADAIDIIYPLTGLRVVPDPGIINPNTAGGSTLG